MNEDFSKEIDAKLKLAIEEGFVSEEKIQGVSQELIDNLEKYFSIIFPQVYKLFLLKCGVEAGELLSHSVVRNYSGLTDLKKEVEEMISEEQISFSTPAPTFFFASFQGVDYWYFLCDGSDDPDVYKLEEGVEKPIHFSRLSSFLIQAFKESIHELEYFSGKRQGLAEKFFPSKY